MPFQFFRPVIKKIDAALQTMTKASNPVVGVHIHKVKFPKVLWRIDGRCAQETSKVGFEALCSKEEVESITLDRLNNYQSFNLQRFGIGACESLKDLNKGYVEGNPGLASKRSIYGFYSKAFHLSQLRLVANTEGNERDYENEFIVVDAVNPKNFIFSTGPKYRDKLLNGLLVPNEMALFNSSLPKTLRLEDIQSVQTLLPWLVKNNAEEAG
ncbi:hypothetical protein EAS68_11865 [Legionella jordanis]|uniref:hypothetical protein n=1 Tax=Legionella jordanis TaxID=456 RepID=UPI000F00FF74|nr:hypothetical protein [Legionella jordanis]RMX15798.1 hypothetical protein EAS68_11865 [Legionella jordanis]